MMSRLDVAIRLLDDWYATLPLFKDGLPSRGTITGALVVLGRLRASFDLRIGAHVTRRGQSQIIGLSAASVRGVLAEFGETRTISAVGGRSNRGLRGAISHLLKRLGELHLEELRDVDRAELLGGLQRHVVRDYVARYFAVKRVKAKFDQGTATRKLILRIVDDARKSGKAGAVAQYLVGAKLALLYPKKTIANQRASTADLQTGRSGDFEIGTTAFHITTAPMPEVFVKCNQNLEDGMRVYLLVPDEHLEGARQNSELLTGGRVAVESIETFIGTNVDELAHFEHAKLMGGFRSLLDKYNERVREVESDPSMLIEIPKNLER